MRAAYSVSVMRPASASCFRRASRSSSEPPAAGGGVGGASSWSVAPCWGQKRVPGGKRRPHCLKGSFHVLAAGVRVPVIKLTLRGFDSHGDEKPQYDRLLAELAGAVSAFRSNLISAGLWDHVLVMTYSEFGRRVAENSSQGTDHGTASPVFFWGCRVKGGFYGSQPSLADLEQGDLKFSLDFRVLYRTVAQEFWGISEKAVLDRALPGVSATLPLVRAEPDQAAGNL